MQRREALAVIAAGISSPFLRGTARSSGKYPLAPDFAAIERQAADGLLGLLRRSHMIPSQLIYRGCNHTAPCGGGGLVYTRVYCIGAFYLESGEERAKPF